MEVHVKAESDCNSEIKDDPVQPSSRMCTLVHDPSRSRHPFASLANAIKQIVIVKMEDQKTLINCNKKIKQAKDTLKSHTGTKILDEFVTHTEEHEKAVTDGDTALQQDMKDNAFD